MTDLRNENKKTVSHTEEAHLETATSFSLPLPDFFRLTHFTGTLHAQYIKCGNPRCKCANVARHGPYFYYFRRVGGRLTRRYVRPEHVEAVRASIAERQKNARQERKWREMLREMSANRREVDRCLKERI